MRLMIRTIELSLNKLEVYLSNPFKKYYRIKKYLLKLVLILMF